MAGDSSNDLELALKKRARRRLVGAIALVLLMIIVLPMVLQDRAALGPQEAIKITMPDDLVNQPSATLAKVAPIEEQAQENTENTHIAEPIITETEKPQLPVISDADKQAQAENAQADAVAKAVAEEKKTEEKKLAKEAQMKADEAKEAKEAKKAEVKANEEKASEVKKAEVKKPDAKAPEAVKVEEKKPASGESFTIQVGVFSDVNNVKQLQVRLKEAGLDSHTENITTPKGEKIRLRAGRFNSRQEAAYALTKLQAADLTGMVISNK